MKTYGYNRVQMARNLTLEQLAELKQKVMQKHKLEQPNGIHLYDKKGLKKLDEISWAVFYKTMWVSSDQYLTR